MDIPHNTKIHRLNSAIELEEFTYIFRSKTGHMIEDRNGSSIYVSNETIRTYNLSKRIALTEAEELLRGKLNAIHDKMREMNMSFMKVSDVDVIYTRVIKVSREIHQYDHRGFYIESFSNAKQASLKFGGKSPNNIREAANKQRKKAYGYFWSWYKVKKLV